MDNDFPFETNPSISVSLFCDNWRAESIIVPCQILGHFVFLLQSAWIFAWGLQLALFTCRNLAMHDGYMCSYLLLPFCSLYLVQIRKKKTLSDILWMNWTPHVKIQAVWSNTIKWPKIWHKMVICSLNVSINPYLVK